MDRQPMLDLIFEAYAEVKKENLRSLQMRLSDNTPLVGTESELDSVDLINLVMTLEKKMKAKFRSSAKLMGEKLAKYYTREKKIEVVSARPFNAYGPRDYFDEATSHVIPAIMKRILDGDDPVMIWGSGNQSRVFVHAKDIARGMMLVTEKAPPAVPINIGHDEEVTIKELFHVLCKVIGKSPKAEFDRTKPDGYPRRAADTSLLKRITGFVPSISLEDGIREMLDSFMSLKQSKK